jgi:hypothetical protein
MRFALFLMAALSAFAADEWIPIFDGRTLDGWKAGENPGAWTVKDGAIRGDGSSSQLFYMDERCQNCEFKADVRVEPGGNSGVYIRAPFGPGVPQGYEAPLDHNETIHVVVEGNHIQVFSADKLTLDTTDEKNAHTDGFIVLREDHPGNVIEFRNVLMRVLPTPKTPLAGTWRQSSSGAEFRILEERDGIRYQSSAGVNYFARPDGYDYRVAGSPDYDHVSIQEVDRHMVHFAMRTVKLRKKQDPRTFLVQTTKDYKPVARIVYTVSPDGGTLTVEDPSNQAGPQKFAKAE